MSTTFLKGKSLVLKEELSYCLGAYTETWPAKRLAMPWPSEHWMESLDPPSDCLHIPKDKKILISNNLPRTFRLKVEVEPRTANP